MFLEEITKFSNSYLVAKKEDFVQHPLREEFCHNVPMVLKEEAQIDDNYKILASCGQGQWSEIPWICVMDKRITSSPQEGYYIVYLFSTDLKKVYLALALGWTQYENQYGALEGRRRSRMSVVRIRKLFKYDFGDFSSGRIDLETNNILGKGYESGTICHKVYDLANMPREETLIKDFKICLDFYQRLQDKIGNNLSELTTPKEDQVLAEEFEEEITRAVLRVRSPEEARERLDQISEEIKKEPKEIRVIKAYRLARNAKLSKLIKEEASYKCQICGAKPFKKSNNQPYAEAHHKEELSSSKIDHPDNMICVCPLCHKIIHYGAQEELEKREKLVGGGN